MIRPPSLAGQSARYLLSRLDAFAEAPGTGPSASGWQPMRGIAAGLDAAERADVAAFFAGLVPGQTPAPKPGPGTADDSAVAEGLVAGVCSRCHTASLAGDAAAAIPNLTGQSTEFIALQLWAFHSERRPSSQMLEVAEALDTGRISALARHLGALPHQAGSVPAGAGIPPADLAAAQDLIGSGDAARGIPACSACHDTAARDTLAFVPRLDGQGQAYLERRLAGFAEGRGAAAYSPMTQIAPALTVAERRALSQVYAGR
jgi:cytochrome c553